MRVLCITEHSDRPEAETIIGLKRHGVDMHVFCPPGAPHLNRFLQSGVQTTPFNLTGRINVRAIRFIRRWIIEKKIDILHLFNNRAVSNGLLASMNLPVRIIVYRGVVGNISCFNPGSWMTYLHPRVDRIICVSEAIRRFFLNKKCLWMHFPSDRPVTVYKGHDLDWYHDQPVDLGQFGIPKGAFVVGCTGRSQPHKGIHILVDALCYLPKELPIHLVLIGKMNAPALLKRIRNSPRADRIHLVGFRSDAPALQAACNIVVLPTLKREGLSKVIIEAMAYGIPPIVTNAGGNPELVENGVSGIVVQPGRPQEIAQAVLRLYEDPSMLKQMGQKARERIGKCFRIESTIEQTLRLYESLCP
ncbi:MAG: glycosyltransferase family 1 protein [Desulfobacteraceae bacterium]|nr:MAG: glycosyltransferase family 1 protein [Desulfobacteraceae bacterium]